jgi:hypothetical protein
LPNFGAFAIGLGAMLAAAFVGLVASFLPWQFALLFLGLIAAVGLSTTNPLIGLILVLALIFEVIPSAFQPRLPFNFGSLQSTDIILGYLVVVVTIYGLWARQRPLLALGPFQLPLFYLAICMTVSLVYVRYFAPNAQAMGEARTAIAWFILPLIALAVDSHKRARLLLRSVCVMGLIIALYVCIQSIFKIRIMTGLGLVAILDNSGNSDIVRSIAGGGIYIVLFTLYLVINRMLQRRLFWLWGACAALLLLTCLSFQFGRAVWVAALAGLLVSALRFGGVGGAFKVFAVSAFALGLLMSSLAVFNPRLAEAITERAVGIGAEIESGGSFNWRKLENAYAIAQIEKHPIMGVGIGGQYKLTASTVGHFGNEQTYIHNGYLVFPLKMGLWATFIPLAFIVAFVITLRQGRSRHQGRDDIGLAAALMGAFVVPVIASYTQPEWTDPRGIAAFALMMGLALKYRQFGSFQSEKAMPEVAGPRIKAPR